MILFGFCSYFLKNLEILGMWLYAGKVFEFGFEWGFLVWLGFGVFLVFCLPSGLRFSTKILESLSVFLMALEN